MKSMRPFYSEDGITIYHAKAEDVVAHLDRGYFAVLLMDPPFTFTAQSALLFDRAMRRDAQIAVLAANGVSFISGYGLRSETFDIEPHAEFGHPHVRPLAAMKEILARTEGPILDPYMGTGTTLVAARELGREAVGIEFKDMHCITAAERLARCSEAAQFDS